MDITSRKNEKVLHMKKLGTSKAYRLEHSEFLCDGEKLLEEAVKWGAEVHDVFVCGTIGLTLPKSARVFNVTEDIIKAVSPLKNPQNVVFSCAIPLINSDDIPAGAVILENMQDPGNVGTMMRAANAFGAGPVVLLDACADPWNAKTARASMGAVFREKIIIAGMEDIVKMKNRGIRLIGTALEERSCDIRNVKFSNCAVVIGNEGQGVSEEMLSMCDELVIIPMMPECESLNAAAAAAIVMWEMNKENL